MNVKSLIEHNDDKIPVYVDQLFKNMLGETDCAAADVGRSNDASCYVGKNGYELLVFIIITLLFKA